MNPRLSEAELPGRIWQELQRAPRDKHHGWRTPVLATVDAHGLPNARTVVLRQTDPGAQTLVCFTDARSPKCAELRQQPGALLAFWSQRLGWQLRVQVRAVVQTEGPEVDAAWARVGASPAASDYLSGRAPGAALMPHEPASGHHHLALLRLQVLAIDWLELHRDGHRRARLADNGLDWLTP